MEKSGEVILRYVKAYESGKQDAVNAFLHPSYLYYPPGEEKPMNLKGRIEDEKFFFSAFSEIKNTVEDLITEGDRVSCRITMHCTHTGDYQGIPRTNRRIAIRYMEILHLKDGKILEEWAEFDPSSILNQLR